LSMQATSASWSANPFVDYLNSLRTQQADGNPSYVHETRQVFLDALRAHWNWLPSDDDLHVPGRLDNLLEALRDRRATASVVFLTGDAGDGKTALCARLAAALGHTRPLDPVTVIGGWAIIKDASELPEDDLRNQLSQHLCESDGRRLILAINEGRLRRIFRVPFAKRPVLWEEIIAPSLDASLNAERAASLDKAMETEHVLVVNFRHRFHIRSLLAPLLETWTKPPLWETGPACSVCPSRAVCPIIANITSLREQHTREYLADMLTAVHFSGQRLPFRRLQAVLALAVTGGLSCQDVVLGPLQPASAYLDRLRYRFYEAIFRTDQSGPVAVQPEMLTFSLAPIDPGRNSDRDFDEKAAATIVSNGEEHTTSLEGVCLPPLEAGVIKALRKEIASGSEEISSKVARVVRSLRRWAAMTTGRIGEGYFWREALRLLEDYAVRDRDEPLRQVVVAALNQLHHVDGAKTDALAAHQVDPGGFRDDTRLGLEMDLGTDFETRLRKGPVLPQTQIAPWLEACSSEIYLQAWPRGQTASAMAYLQLDARLVSAFLGVTAGYRSYGTLGPYRRDLARFFSQLAELAIKADHHPTVSLRNGRVRVCARNINGRLRFDVEA
jgi:hypothetical protein